LRITIGSLLHQPKNRWRHLCRKDCQLNQLFYYYLQVIDVEKIRLGNIILPRQIG